MRNGDEEVAVVDAAEYLFSPAESSLICRRPLAAVTS